MERKPDNLERNLQLLARGELDALSPEEIAGLEALLNEDPRLASVLADQRGAPGDPLLAAVAAADAAAMPSTAQWERAWGKLAEPAASAVSRGRRPLILRLWQPFAAAAACVALIALWVTGKPANRSQMGPTDDWPIELATNVVIDELEVFDGSTAYIIPVGGKGAQVIWILPGDI